MCGKRCSNMLSVTWPRKPVPPMRKRLRSRKISVGESVLVVIAFGNPLAIAAKFAAAPGAVMFQQINCCRLISLHCDVERCARVRDHVYVSAAQEQFLNYGCVAG